MAFRRRARSRFRGSRFQKARTSWVRGLFNEQSITRDATNNEFILLSGADWQTDQSGLNKKGYVKRTIVKGAITVVPNQTAGEVDHVAMFAALYVVDLDDTDTTIIGVGSGGILQGSRVLWQDCFGHAILESASALTDQSVILPTFGRIEIDIGIKVVLEPDQVLTLGIQTNANVTNVLASINFSGYATVLIEQP